MTKPSLAGLARQLWLGVLRNWISSETKDVAWSTEAAHLLTHTPPVTTCLLAFTGSCSIKQADEETFLQIRNTYLWAPSLTVIFTYFPEVQIRKEAEIRLWESPTTIQNYRCRLFWFPKSHGPKTLDDNCFFQCWKTYYCKIVGSVINSCQRAHSSPCLLKVAAWCRGHTPGWSQPNPL